MITLAPQPVITDQTHDDLTHVVCVCDPDTALCGTNVTDSDWVDDDEDATCIVCRDLEGQPCQRCGQ